MLLKTAQVWLKSLFWIICRKDVQRRRVAIDESNMHAMLSEGNQPVLERILKLSAVRQAVVSGPNEQVGCGWPLALIRRAVAFQSIEEVDEALVYTKRSEFVRED